MPRKGKQPMRRAESEVKKPRRGGAARMEVTVVRSPRRPPPTT